MGLIRGEFPAHYPFRCERPVPASAILNSEQSAMQLEFHQLDRRWEHLRVREPHRQRRLMPVVLKAAASPPNFRAFQGWR